MIQSFADTETRDLYVTGKSRRLPPDLIQRALRRLEYINLANDLSDLAVPSSNRLHALKGDRMGQHSISINDQWRICFEWQADGVHHVEIVDYH